MKKQITFKGSYAQRDAVRWLTNLEGCFYINSARIQCKEIKEETNCTIEVSFE